MCVSLIVKTFIVTVTSVGLMLKRFLCTSVDEKSFLFFFFFNRITVQVLENRANASKVEEMLGENARTFFKVFFLEIVVTFAV